MMTMQASESPPPTSQDTKFASPMAFVIGLIVMAVALTLTVLAAQPPAAQPENAPADAFSADRAMALLGRLLGDEAPHPIGSEANAQVADRIAGELTALGYAVETQTTFACRTAWAVCGEVTNVLTRLPGQEEGPSVLLTAHYDSVAAGPGAADDMAGVAAILEVARIMRDEQPRNPVVFLLSDGEEPGLLGAEAFVAEHPWAAQVGAVVNLEANGTHGQSVLFESTENNAWLIDAYANHAPRPVASSLADEVYAFLPFNTDLTVYEEAGLPGINFAFTEEHPQYHTPLDRLDNVDPGSVQHHGDNALAAVRAFSALDLTNPPAGNSVYQDVLPGLVLRWSEPWTIWLALASFVVWLGVTAMAIRRRDLRLRDVLWGLLVLPLGLLGATLLGLALGIVVSTLAGEPAPWYANPLPMRVALWACGLLSVGLVATAVACRAGFLGLFLAVWLWWALLAIAVAVLAPAASMLVLVPTAVAGIVAVIVTVTPWHSSPRAWQIAALVALLGASWMWLGFTRGSDYTAVSPDLAPMMGFAVGIVAGALAPFVALPAAYARMRRWSLVGLALLVAIAAGVALLVPVYSATRPERLNIFHVEDRQSGEAFWAIDGEGRMPEALQRAGSFSDESVAVLPWSSQQYEVSLATPAAAAEAVELRAEARDGNERLVRLPLQDASEDGSERVTISVPQAADLNRIDILETGHALEAILVEDGYQQFQCFGQRCAGLTLEISLEQNEAPVTMFVANAVSGLPEGGDVLRAARPDTAAPSGSGDASLIIERVVVPPS